jgi:hypothetical protein
LAEPGTRAEMTSLFSSFRLNKPIVYSFIARSVVYKS